MPGWTKLGKVMGLEAIRTRRPKMPSNNPATAPMAAKPTFGKKLAPQSQAARSQSHAQRDLSLPRFRTRQQKIRNIGAGDQQHERNSTQ